MAHRPEDPPGGDDHLAALDGPSDDELEYSGPGAGDDRDHRLMPDAFLPGGVDHTTAAAGAGGLGLVLLGIAGIFKRRSARRRREDLDA